MAKYTVKRLLQSLLTVFIIVSIVFVLMRMLPTDYYFTEEQQMKYDEETKHDMLQAAGLLDPIPTQLFRFYRGLLRLVSRGGFRLAFLCGASWPASSPSPCGWD